MGSAQRRVIVVGAGVVGASIAWHLSVRGAHVTIIDKASTGGVATPKSFAWINSNFGNSETYFRLRHHSMGEWRRLARDVPGLPVSLSGSIYFPEPDYDLSEFVERNSAWGYRVELIDARQVRELEPNLTLEFDAAARAHDEGAAEPDETARVLVADAVSRGAVLRENAEVARLAVGDRGVSGVIVNAERLNADDVVVAAGVATADLVRETGFEVPLEIPPRPGLLVHTKPLPKLLNGLVLADGLHVRQKLSGEIVAGADFQGGHLNDDLETSVKVLLGRIRGALRTDHDVVLGKTTTGYRPKPVDGVPAVGRVPGVDGLYVAVTHSGITLCPAIGAFAAREILEGDRDELLAPFGLERFAIEADTAAE